ncbi:MAG: AAA family ATPase [Victivallaceae bacterium]|nr:AAA family ATPase [Victivallaceae bacterium]
MQENNIQEIQLKIREKAAFIAPLRTEMGRVIAGQQELVDRLIMALICGGHVLIEGVPGLAKTLAVKTLADCVSGSFARLQFTPDLLPADLTGTRVYNAETHDFSTRLGPVFANIVLADEINRAPAKVQSALLECMQEHQITISGETHKLPEPFMVMATQNPIEQEGTYPLPEAQVDRFMMKLRIGYPERADERLVLDRMAHPTPHVSAMKVASLDDIAAAREAMDLVYMDEKITEYILDIVNATRPGRRTELSDRQSEAKLDDVQSLIEYGASPRSGIALALAAKTLAFMSGRAYVVPQDIKSVAADVLRHRLTLSYEAEAEDLSADDLILRLLNELRTP